MSGTENAALTGSLTVRMPVELHKQLADYAWEQRSSMNREIIIALLAHLDAQGKGASK